MNFHCIPVTGEIYSLEHSMHSLLRLNEITFNALISQQRTFYLSEPFWALALCEDVSAWPGQCETATMVSVKAALPKSSSVFGKKQSCFSRTVACPCAGAVGSRRGQGDVLTLHLWLTLQPMAGCC